MLRVYLYGLSMNIFHLCDCEVKNEVLNNMENSAYLKCSNIRVYICSFILCTTKFSKWNLMPEMYFVGYLFIIYRDD